MINNEEGTRAAGMGRCDKGSVPQQRGSRHPYEHLGHGPGRQRAPNEENAIKLMEFLASAEGQEIYAERS